VRWNQLFGWRQVGSCRKKLGVGGRRVGSSGRGRTLGRRPGGTEGVCGDTDSVWGGFWMRWLIANDMLAHSSATEFHLASRVLILSERHCFSSRLDVRMMAISVWIMLSSSCPNMSLFIHSSH